VLLWSQERSSFPRRLDSPARSSGAASGARRLQRREFHAIVTLSTFARNNRLLVCVRFV
jgi:hypothetical protein